MRLGPWTRLGIILTAMWSVIAPLIILGRSFELCDGGAQPWYCDYIVGPSPFAFQFGALIGLSRMGLWGNVIWLSAVIPFLAWIAVLTGVQLGKWVLAGRARA